jgi:hypothetical protein
MQMKSLLIVKMCNKANIFKNQLGYFRNLWDINKLWAHCEVLINSMMLMVSIRESLQLCPSIYIVS